MWSICTKEWQHFFSGLIGYLTISIFLIFNGLYLFVFPHTNILDYGYASLDKFFSLAPWVFLFLIPAIAMRSFSDEYKAGTFELLQTLPISSWKLVLGKFIGIILIVSVSIIPTIVYVFAIQALSTTGGLDIGSVIGSYVGLLLLGCCFSAICMGVSSFTNNMVIAFLIGIVMCLIFFIGFDTIGNLSVFDIGLNYYISLLGIQFHYNHIQLALVLYVWALVALLIIW